MQIIVDQKKNSIIEIIPEMDMEEDDENILIDKNLEIEE